MATTIDQQFVEYIVKSLVGKPDGVKVDRRIDEKGVLLELTVDPEDLGRVIGKRGSTAQSIRTLLRALGTKNDARYNLKIVDTGPAPLYAKASTSAGASSDKTEGEPAEAVETGEDRKEQLLPREPVATATTTAAADDVDLIEDDELPEKPSEESEHSDVVSRTRKELADLDDLDV